MNCVKTILEIVFYTVSVFVAPNVVGCVVLDVRIPGMNGLELQKKLSLEGKQIPVIIITGHGDVPMAVEALKSGAFDFFEKPFRAQPLLSSIEQAVEHDRARHSALMADQQLSGRFGRKSVVDNGRPSKISCSLGRSQGAIRGSLAGRCRRDR